MEVIGTTPGKEEVELRLEQQPRVEPGRLHGSKRFDSMDGIGRVESGTETEKMYGTYFPAEALPIWKEVGGMSTTPGKEEVE